MIQERIRAGDWNVGVLNLEQIKLHRRSEEGEHLPPGHRRVVEGGQPGTKQSEVMYNLAMSCDSCFLLSGNPAPNDLDAVVSTRPRSSPVARRSPSVAKPMNQMAVRPHVLLAEGDHAGHWPQVKVRKTDLLKHREGGVLGHCQEVLDHQAEEGCRQLA